MRTLAFRLHPNQDLKLTLDKIAHNHNLEAACILTCVGSLKRVSLRFADQPRATVLEDKFEILTLTGTFSVYGAHYHLSIADVTGQTLGGHLLPGCLIYTTVELVIGVIPGLKFLRVYDEQTGHQELAIQPIVKS